MLIETTIKVSVRKLGSIERESVPINKMLTVEASRSWRDTAVGLGVTSVAPARGVMLKAPSVGCVLICAVGVAVAAVVGRAELRCTGRLASGDCVPVAGGSIGVAVAVGAASDAGGSGVEGFLYGKNPKRFCS